MIATLRGALVDRSGDYVVIEVAGVGYQLTVSPSTSVSLGELGDEVFVHVHHHFREDNQTLYGFTVREERVCFEALISAHGVGPSLGLAILGVHDPAGLAAVLATEDLAALCLVPGVGKKTAQRLLVELKEKLELPSIDLTAAPAGSMGDTPGLSDVREALAGLGYGPDEIYVALKGLAVDSDTSTMLKQALQRLAVNS